MTRSTSAVLLLACAGLLLPACKKPSDTSVPASTAAPASAAAPAPPPPPDTTPPASAAPTPAPAPVANTAPAGGSIDACCAALAVGARRGPPALRSKAAQAAEVCPGIALRVQQGSTSRAAGLTQVKSALAGGPAPAACN